MLEQLLAAMATRPLVLLCGISGSGKTQLARRLGEFRAAGHLGGDTAKGQLQQLENLNLIESATVEACKIYKLKVPPPEGSTSLTAVQSDWIEASNLWGYRNRLEKDAKFEGTPALRSFLDAWQSWIGNGERCNHVVILDEMNLSRPEHYAADLLSAMELMPEERSGPESIAARTERATKTIRLHNEDGSRPLAGGGKFDVPNAIAWPPGLVVIGTVNIDETTHAFAPKVLDRAAVLEFTKIPLDGFCVRRKIGEKVNFSDLPETVQGWVKQVQAATEPASLHLGYRAITEVVDALSFRLDANTAKWETTTGDCLKDALDDLLCDKVLPRVRGARGQVEDVLLALWDISRRTQEGLRIAKTEDLPKALEQEHRALRAGKEPETADSGKQSRAQRKIIQMLKRLHAVGFTSYF
ncbi:MAG: hypothetical protein FJ102_24015 [Deltaproteobacteria bacterium]|nr:hypothetical protein [Deltaproteobacteria bacterium]